MGFCCDYLWEFPAITLAFPIRGVGNAGSIRQRKLPVLWVASLLAARGWTALLLVLGVVGYPV